MKIKSLLISFVVLLLLTGEVFSQPYIVERRAIVDHGISLGSAIAVVISWSRNNSVIWAIVHGIFSWLYIIYYLITRDDKITN